MSKPRGVPDGRGLGEFANSIANSQPDLPDPEDIAAVVSRDRFKPYLDACDGQPNVAIALYRWNIALSAAYWEVIAVAEVAMRNAMDECLTDAYGPRWFRNDRILDDRSLEAGQKAERRASRGLTRGSRPTPGKVVSELNFGSWTALLDRGGYSSWRGGKLRYRDTLWVPALQYAFPHGPQHQRKTNRGLRVVQRLRNRIAHHEKVFPEPFRGTDWSHAELHAHCLDVTGWISPTAASWASQTSRIRSILSRNPLDQTRSSRGRKDT